MRGIFLHPMLAVTPNRECLGIVDYEQWSRERLKNQTPKERKAQNRLTPSKEKESYRWVRGYKKRIGWQGHYLRLNLFIIADREGDIYEIYHEAKKALGNGQAEFVIRGFLTERY